MNKTFISKMTRLAVRVATAQKRWLDLDKEFGDLKRECDHRTPEGKLTLKTVRVPKRGSVKAYTFRACTICGAAIYKDCYGRSISAWNHQVPEERKRDIEKLWENSSQT